MRLTWRSAVAVLVLLVVQAVFIPLIGIEGIVPDLLLIWVVYCSVRYGQIPATVGGFLVGLLQDIVAGQFLGLAAFSKTLTGFILGFFYNENRTEKTLTTYRFPVTVLVASLLHNLLYFSIHFLGSDMNIAQQIVSFTAFTSVYTLIAAVFPMFFFYRSYGLMR